LINPIEEAKRSAALRESEARVAQIERDVAEKARAIAVSAAERRCLHDENSELSMELVRAERALQAVVPKGPEIETEIGVDLAGRGVLYFGGRKSAVSHAMRLAERCSVCLLHHDGDLGQSVAERESTRMRSAADARAVTSALATMDLGVLAERRATELSGGETARVVVVRALAQEASLLVADEPTAGLDPAHQIALMELFHRLAVAGGAVLVSLHELGLAARFCDRVVLLERGRVVADGPPEEALSPERLAAVYGVTVHRSRDAGGLVLVPTGLVVPREEMRSAASASSSTVGRRGSSLLSTDLAQC
jgi:ABC-type dipeptide/oligopeptide/nickel transport system ATPase subunit